ncbi:MAG: SUMF1/EgtB/PvdO family nonheme iron enzyme [Planctomycetes bacterium]|nr:SUMF1/EgtB/PvdO family nonheme iron enzyme [Planctomycetota bacterium]
MRFIGALLIGLLAPRFASGQGAKTFTNTLGMKFARIEPGRFIMGTGAEAPKSRAEWSERDHDEAPAHPVTISKGYFLGAHEVTNVQYEAFDPGHKAWRGKRGSSRADDEPVAYVSWHDANAFCKWLAKKEGKPYRLPTEAEWENACRAGTATRFHTGDKLTLSDANFSNVLASKPRKVGSFPPNAWGLFDMHGNVAEWCLDWYGPYAAGAQTDPVGRAGGYARVTRGWSFLRANLNPTRYGRSANRAGHLPEDANAYTGFRVVLGEMPKTTPLPVVLEAYQKNVKQNHPQPLSRGGERGEEPWFINYVKERRHPIIPKDSWGPIFSQHNHYSAIGVCPNGDVLACWYTCVSESGREMAQACSRLRAGADKWDEACLFFDVPDVNDHAPVLFCDGKRIFHFCTQSLFGWDNASNIVRWSDDNGVTWSHPRIMVTRDAKDRLSQPCSAFQASDGTLVLACDGDNHVDERLMISKDRGLTWKVARGDMRKAYGGKYVIHPAIVPTKDGAILSFLRGQHLMPVLTSKDWGDTWAARTTPFPGIGTGQKIAALRLASGAILLCAHDNKNTLVGGGTYAALSLDDGKTWPHVRKVEGVGGYMSVAQARDAKIYLFGTRMGCVAFNEAWVREGKGVAEK